MTDRANERCDYHVQPDHRQGEYCDNAECHPWTPAPVSADQCVTCGKALVGNARMYATANRNGPAFCLTCGLAPAAAEACDTADPDWQGIAHAMAGVMGLEGPEEANADLAMIEEGERLLRLSDGHRHVSRCYAAGSPEDCAERMVTLWLDSNADRLLALARKGAEK